jgi:hypothetical protein
MMGLAEFALVSRKWKPATLVHKNAAEYTSLLEYVTRKEEMGMWAYTGGLILIFLTL